MRLLAADRDRIVVRAGARHLHLPFEISLEDRQCLSVAQVLIGAQERPVLLPLDALGTGERTADALHRAVDVRSAKCTLADPGRLVTVRPIVQPAGQLAPVLVAAGRTAASGMVLRLPAYTLAIAPDATIARMNSPTWFAPYRAAMCSAFSRSAANRRGWAVLSISSPGAWRTRLLTCPKSPIPTALMNRCCSAGDGVTCVMTGWVALPVSPRQAAWETT
uniref:Uncharacterized protein n=1 Tax=Anopheles coluzzii TaxID=1518534 RepID=A0A8W7P123_ANOCL